MSVLAVGDIHGCSVALEALLSSMMLQPEDTIVTLGDYVDRGPDSRGVLDRLLALSRDYHVVALRGNHEQMLLKARQGGEALHDWEQEGGEATLSSYGSLAAVPPEHWRFIEDGCVDYWECDTHFFVHGGAYPDLPLWEQPSYKLYWGRFVGVKPHESGKVMVCGHTSQKSGLPLDLGYAVCIDTWACGEGWLSCLDVGTGLVRQANQSGQVRQMWLTDLTGGRSV